jgi:hypothetical protein
MGGMRALVAAGFLALAGPAAATCPDSETRFAPAWNGPFKTYGIETNFVDALDGGKSVAGKTAKLCTGCETPVRGLQLTSKREFGNGYLQLPFAVGATFCAEAFVDLSRMTGPESFAVLEFDSPAVGVAESPTTFVSVSVETILGVRRVSALVNGTPVGTPLELADETTGVAIELSYAGNQVDVSATPLGAEAATTIVANAAFAFAGSGKLGAGAFSLARADRTGIDLEVSGEIFTAALRDVLAGIDEQRGLVGGAISDLENEVPADARAKIEEALLALDPALVAAVAILPESKVQAFAAAQLGKALAKLTQARDAIDAATPASLTSAEGGLRKAALAFHRADRALRNGSVAEAKIPPAS